MEKTEPSLSDCLEVVKSITKGMICTPEDLDSRARILFLINRLQTLDNIKVLLDEITYQKSIVNP